jgi:hypothetical protein
MKGSFPVKETSMKNLLTMAITLGILFPLGRESIGATGSTPKKKDPAVTIWILSYQRRDDNPLSDDVFLPKLIKQGLPKLKDKGARKIHFDSKQRHLDLWFEGKKAAILKDIQTAFPILELKMVAKAVFPGDS